MKKIAVFVIIVCLLCGCAPSIERSAHPVILALDVVDGQTEETGLYCMPQGESVEYVFLQTQGYTQAEARAKKEGYSFDKLNYSLLSTLVLGKSFVQNGMFSGLEMLFNEYLPEGSIMLCAVDGNASGMLRSASAQKAASTVPLLPQSAGSNNLMPQCSLAQVRVAKNDGCPLMLPRVVYDDRDDEFKLDGAILCGDGVLSVLDSYSTALWTLLYNPTSAGILYIKQGGAFNCKICRSIGIAGNTVEAEIKITAVPLALHGTPVTQAAQQLAQQICNDATDLLNTYYGQGIDLIYLTPQAKAKGIALPVQGRVSVSVILG